MPYPEDNYGSTQERERLASAKKQLWSVLSNSKYNGDPHTATEIEYRPIADVIKLNQAKTEMRSLLSGQSRGITDQTKDASDTNTASGTPFVGQNGITCRGRNYLDLLQEEKDKANSTPSPSPASTGTGNWSTGHKTAYSASVLPFDADNAKSDLISLHTRKNGTVEKQASNFFLNVAGDGSEKSHYSDAIPLAVVHPVSAQPVYHPDAIDRAFPQASLPQKAKLIRLKRKNKMPLTSDQKYHVRKSSGADMMADI